MSFRFFIADDGAPDAWAPFRLTRPVGEMLYGAETLRARCERVLGVRCDGCVGRAGIAKESKNTALHAALEGFEEPGAPPCLIPPVAPRGARASGVLVLSGRFVPGEEAFASLRATGTLGPEFTTLVVGAEIAGLWLPRDKPLDSEDWPWRPSASGRSEEGAEDWDWPRHVFSQEDISYDRTDGSGDPYVARATALSPPSHWPELAVDGTMLDSVWELMDSNGARIAADAHRFQDCDLPPGVHRVGDGMVGMADGVRIDPGVVFDVSEGPVLLDEGVRVRAFSRIAGPAYIGPKSAILGGSISATSIGPACRVHGEVSASALLGFANKAHGGFLGHSVVGRWVNLGAGTTNSNLKNTYGPVRCDMVGKGPSETGLVKAGCLLGDHVRTGIGTLLDTGSVIGAGSVLFGGTMPPKHVPPFSWAGPGPNDLDECDIDRFLVTAERVMARRGQSLSDGMRRLYRRAFRETRPLRTPAP